MSTTDQMSDNEKAVNRLDPGRDDFILRHALFSEQSVEEQICSRAISTLHFLCPELRESRYVIPDSVQNVEEIN